MTRRSHLILDSIRWCLCRFVLPCIILYFTLYGELVVIREKKLHSLIPGLLTRCTN